EQRFRRADDLRRGATAVQQVQAHGSRSTAGGQGGFVKMRVVIKPDYEAMSRWAAAYVAAKIIEHQKASNRAFVLGLPTGSTPLGFYRELVRLHRSGVVDLGGIVTFNMDEYVGIDANHPQSYAAFMRENFFGPAGLDPKQTNLLDGCA